MTKKIVETLVPCVSPYPNGTIIFALAVTGYSTLLRETQGTSVSTGNSSEGDAHKGRLYTWGDYVE